MEKNDKVIIAFKLTCFSGHSLYFNINIYLFLILNISFIFHLFIIVLREKFLILYFSLIKRLPPILTPLKQNLRNDRENPMILDPHNKKKIP